MDNDLISRSELKKKIMSVYNNVCKTTGEHEPERALLWCITQIDNAPTVGVISNEEGYEMYGKGYLQGYERGKNERPKGEWVKTTSESNYYEINCSECGHGFEYECQATNFCPNCGAKMT